ncbi:hypothetical protein [Solemya elarraichensis gill symbiont]|uniref:Uncharacterized protein n=1 Tax=Solemya elarraichensis gill symbiont TaxID=1918949 RepID=A0A1T2LBN5_9GAMM|nr:hypothetical protein [Solemya elarraichensis gill symbiont]OOZ42517.1 hypothetical protein BOW52_02805 [Solemya elarraichensis gill symbiont]
MNKVFNATLALLFALLMSGASLAADPMTKMADSMKGAMDAAADTAKDRPVQEKRQRKAQPSQIASNLRGESG